jgi:inhibitor of KinA sporulation pathway (predicted exonuclease)
MNFIIYDLEATCWENRPTDYKQEIIEIGAVMLDAYGEELGTFNRFVRPILHPDLSFFCKGLTGIEQRTVDKASTFQEVIESFQDWAEVFYEDYRLCAWGSFDEKMLYQDCNLHDIETDWLDDKCLNIKRQFQELKGLRQPWGLKKTIDKLGFEWSGTAHSGIDDAINLSKIFLEYRDEWRY